MPRAGLNVKKLEKRFAKFLKKVEKRGVSVRAVFEKQVGALEEEIKMTTPKNTGTAQSGWRSALVQNSDTVMAWEIFNAVYYIVYLEYGHSSQSPKGMVRVALYKMSRELVSAIKALR